MNQRPIYILNHPVFLRVLTTSGGSFISGKNDKDSNDVKEEIFIFDAKEEKDKITYDYHR
jgi:hypothetical protein